MYDPEEEVNDRDSYPDQHTIKLQILTPEEDEEELLEERNPWEVAFEIGERKARVLERGELDE